MSTKMNIIAKQIMVITITTVFTCLLWTILFWGYENYKTRQRDRDVREINKSAMAYLNEVSKQKIESDKDSRLSGVMADTLRALQPTYQFKPLFSKDTACLVVYQSWLHNYKGPITITMVYIQDNKTGKRWYYPERYREVLEKK